MTINHIPIKSFLGQYYSELLYSASQEKYKDTGLDNFFEQKFKIQGNKTEMMVDPGMEGLSIKISGNEIHVSKELYEHPNIIVSNSLENKTHLHSPRNLYNPEVFSSMAYLVCQNHTVFQITGDVDEPIYVKYTGDYECFYNSIVVFEVSNDTDIELVEEIESVCAINSLVNYVLHPNSKINLKTFYRNNISAISFMFRNIILQDGAEFNGIVLGNGSSNVIDENRINIHDNSIVNFTGLIKADNSDFHSIFQIQTNDLNYKIDIDYNNLNNKSNITFFPITQHFLLNSVIEDKDIHDKSETKYISDLCILTRMSGVKRYYDNKAKFFNSL